MDKYVALVKPLYAEPNNEIILGSFLKKTDEIGAVARDPKIERTPSTKKLEMPNRDIRSMFTVIVRKSSDDKQTQTDKRVLID